MRNCQVQMKHGRSKHKDQILRQSKQLVQWGTGFGRRKRTKESWHEYKVEDNMTEQSSHTAKQKRPSPCEQRCRPTSDKMEVMTSNHHHCTQEMRVHKTQQARIYEGFKIQIKWTACERCFGILRHDEISCKLSDKSETDL